MMKRTNGKSVKSAAIWPLLFSFLCPFPCAANPIIVKGQPGAPASELVELADAVNVNTLIYIDNFKYDGAKRELPRRPEADAGLVELALHYGLNVSKNPNGTLLMWPEPDYDKLADALTSGSGWGPERPGTADKEFSYALNHYLNETLNGEEVKFRIGDLPRPLAEKLAGIAMAQLTGNGERDYKELWLQDDFWTASRIAYTPASTAPTTPLVSPAKQSLMAFCTVRDGERTRRIRLDLRHFFPGLIASDAPPPGEVARISEVATVRAMGLTDPAGEIPLRGTLRPAGTALRQVSALENGQGHLVPSPALERPFHWKATQVSPAELLERLAQSSGLQLSVAPEAREEVSRSTLCLNIESMTCRQVLESLARLLNMTWTNSLPGGYLLQRGGANATEVALRRLGNGEYLHYRFQSRSAVAQRDKEFDDLAREIVDDAGPEILAPAGVAFTALSPDLQRKLRQHGQQGIARLIVGRTALAQDYLEAPWEFARPKGDFSLALLVAGARPRRIVLPFPGRGLDRGRD